MDVAVYTKIDTTQANTKLNNIVTHIDGWIAVGLSDAGDLLVSEVLNQTGLHFKKMVDAIDLTAQVGPYASYLKDKADLREKEQKSKMVYQERAFPCNYWKYVVEKEWKDVIFDPNIEKIAFEMADAVADLIHGYIMDGVK